MYRKWLVSEPDPIRAVKPLLSETLPVKKAAIPPSPVVIIGDPSMMMLPPVAIPATSHWPALKMIADGVAFVVVTGPEMVKLPVRVATLIGPVAVIPETVSSFPSTSETALAFSTRTVEKLLEVFVNVTLPEPDANVSVPAVAVTAPEAVISLFAVVSVVGAPKVVEPL